MVRLIFLYQESDVAVLNNVNCSNNPTQALFINCNSNDSTNCFDRLFNTNTPSLSCNIGWSIPNNSNQKLRDLLIDVFCNDIFDNLPCLYFTCCNVAERAQLLDWFPNKSINLRLNPRYQLGSNPTFNAFEFAFDFSQYVELSVSGFYMFKIPLANSTTCINPNFLSDILEDIDIEPCLNNFVDFNFGFSYSGLWEEYDLDPYNLNPSPSECVDERTSTDSQQIRFIVSDGNQNVSDFTITLNISDGSTQEFGIKTYMNDTLYNSFINLYNLNQNVIARCMFVSGNVRPSCTVRLVAKVYGESLGVGTSATPPYVDLDFNPLLGTDVDVLRAQFEPCNDKPIRIQEDLTAFINGLKANVPTVGFSLYQVIPYKVIVSGLTESLVDYCCDDSTPIDDDSIEYTSFIEPILQGYGGSGSGGGDNVDLTCVCNALTDINNSLIAFKNANQTALEGITDTLSDLNIDIDNQCVCDNLEDVVEGLGAIKDSIDYKELRVTNTINPPVNNVSVSSPVNNVSVTVPTTELNTIANRLNPLQSIDGTLANLELIQDNIEEHLKCNKEGEGIACILANKTFSANVTVDNSGIENKLSDIDDTLQSLDDINTNLHDGLINSNDESNLENISQSLNTSDDEAKSLADVINDKDMGANIDVEVSPADDVNVNRVYYTNQRNGDTNL